MTKTLTHYHSGGEGVKVSLQNVRALNEGGWGQNVYFVLSVRKQKQYRRLPIHCMRQQALSLEVFPAG